MNGRLRENGAESYRATDARATNVPIHRNTGSALIKNKESQQWRGEKDIYTGGADAVIDTSMKP